MIREYRVFEKIYMSDGEYMYVFARRFDLEKEALWWIQEEKRHHPEDWYVVRAV